MEFQNAIIDQAGKSSTVTIPVDPAIVAANVTALRNAIDGVTLGTLNDAYLVERTRMDVGSVVWPADQFAQRTTKWLVTMQDSVNGEIFQFTLPTADLDLLSAGTHLLDTGVGTAGETLVTQLEANVFSPDGNAATVVQIAEVARAGQ